MHGLCAFTTQPESQRTKRRKQAPWTIGYKPESVEHSDPAHGLFTFIPIVKNRNGFPPFKDQNTTLGFLAWNGGGAGKANMGSSVLPSKDLVREPLHSCTPTQYLRALLVGNDLWLWVWTPRTLSFYFYISGSCWTHWHHFLSFLIIFCKLSSDLIMHLFSTDLDRLLWLPLCQHYLDQRHFKEGARTQKTWTMV